MAIPAETLDRILELHEQLVSDPHSSRFDTAEFGQLCLYSIEELIKTFRAHDKLVKAVQTFELCEREHKQLSGEAYRDLMKAAGIWE
jgi:hypothetical protein